MRGLYEKLDEWQHANQRQFLSIGIQQDGESYCCIALTGPTEVLITSEDGDRYAKVSRRGDLEVR
jgi:hypothetical protein